MADFELDYPLLLVGALRKSRLSGAAGSFIDYRVIVILGQSIHIFWIIYRLERAGKSPFSIETTGQTGETKLCGEFLRDGR